jgi:DNA-binding beta-propeller fold protein YncE
MKPKSHVIIRSAIGAILTLASLSALAQPFLYVGSDHSHRQLTVIDLATQKVTQTLVDPEYQGPLAANSATQKIWLNRLSGLDDFNPATQTFGTSITSTHAAAIAVNATGTLSYSIDRSNAYIVHITDLALRKEIATIALDATGSPADNLALTPDGKRLYVTRQTAGAAPQLAVIETATKQIVATLGANLLASNMSFNRIAISPAGDQLFATMLINQFSSEWRYLTVDLATNSMKFVTPAIPAGFDATGAGFDGGMAFNADGSRFYVNLSTTTANVQIGRAHV